MPIPSIPLELNLFCRDFINPKIEERIAAAKASGSLKIYSPNSLAILYHRKADSSISTLLKLIIYYMEFNNLGNIIEPGVEIAKINGIPLDTLQESVRWIPQIKILFREKPIEANADKRRPRIAELTIRCNEANRNALGASEEALFPLAEKIGNLFKDIAYKKGYQKYHYRDLDKNYNMSVFTSSIDEAHTLLSALMAINDDTPNWSAHLIYPATTRDYTVTASQAVLGATVPIPPERTEANMLFYRAELHWKGIKPIILVGNSFKPCGAVLELKYI